MFLNPYNESMILYKWTNLQSFRDNLYLVNISNNNIYFMLAGLQAVANPSPYFQT